MIRKRLGFLASTAPLLVGLFLPLTASATSNTNLIDDRIFDNTATMNASQIDSFLNTFPSSCLSTNNGFTAPKPTGYSPSSGFTYGAPETAGQVIYDASQAYELNPQVLLTKLQNEEGLVRGDGPYGCGALSIASSVGYACTDSDTASHTYTYTNGTDPGTLSTPLYYTHGSPVNSVTNTCVNSSLKAGFTEQVIRASWLLKFGRMRSEGNTSWAIVKTNWDNSDDLSTCYGGPMTQGYFKRCPSDTTTTYYDGYTTIDGQSIHMDTGATAALYWYTPHIQSFTTIFTNWFGPPYFTVNISYPGSDVSVDNMGDVAVVPVVLSSPPGGTIQLNYGVSNPSLAKIVGSNAIIFTNSNWNIPQKVVVEGLAGSATSQNFNLQVLFINSPDGTFSQSITPYLAQLPMLWSNTSESAIYRLYNSSTAKHAYAVSANTLSNLQSSGYSIESTLGYQCVGGGNALSVDNSINLVRRVGSSDIPAQSNALPAILFSDSAGALSVTILKNASATDTILSSSSAEINSLEQSGYTPVTSVLLCNQGDAPVYRLYDPARNAHFYTSSASEADSTLNYGFGFEGVSFYNAANDTLPVYRLYDPVGSTHFYTSSATESSNVQQMGFKYEGIAWYAGTASTPVYRLYDPTGNNHFYTSSAAESSAVQHLGFRYEGVGWYAK